MNDEAITQFGQDLRGALIGRDNAEYDEARKVYNGMIDKRPLLIAQCTDAGDVIAAVNFGRENQLPIAIRGGGHNGPGLGSVDDGLVIDLSTMTAFASIPPTDGPGRARLRHRRRGPRDPRLRPRGALRHHLDDRHRGPDPGRRARLLPAIRSDHRQFARGGCRVGGWKFRHRRSPKTKNCSGRSAAAAETSAWSPASSSARIRRAWSRRADPLGLDDAAGNAVVPGIPGRRRKSSASSLACRRCRPAIPSRRSIGERRCVLLVSHNGAAAEAAVNAIRAELPKPIIDWPAHCPIRPCRRCSTALPEGAAVVLEGRFRQGVARRGDRGAPGAYPKVPSELSAMHLYPVDSAVHRPKKDDIAWNCRDATWSMVIDGVDSDPAKAEGMKDWAKDYWEAVHPFGLGGAYLNFMMETRVKTASGRPTATTTIAWRHEAEIRPGESLPRQPEHPSILDGLTQDQRIQTVPGKCWFDLPALWPARSLVRQDPAPGEIELVG